MGFDYSILARFGLETADFDKGLTASQGKVSGFSKALGQIGLGLSAGAVIGFFKEVTANAGRLSDLSKSAGVTTDQLQALTYSAKLNGVDQEALGKSLLNTRTKLDELGQGTKGATDTFAKLHLSQKDFIGLPMGEAIQKIAEAYKASAGEAGALDAVTEILGKQNGPKLLETINALASQGFPALTEAARTAGQVIEADAIARIDTFGDRLDTLKGSLTSFGSTILNGFLSVGEGIGKLAGQMVYGADAAREAFTKSETAATKAVLAIEQVNVAAKGTKATEEDLAKLATARAKSREAELDDAGKLQHFMDQYAAKVNEANGYAADTKEHIEAMVEAEAIRGKMQDLHLKTLKEQKAAQADAEQDLKEAKAEQAKLAEAALSLEDQITKHKKAQVSYQVEAIKAQREATELSKIAVPNDKDVAELAAARTRATQATANALSEGNKITELTKSLEEEQARTAKERLDTEKKVTAEKTRQVSITRTNVTDDQDLTDAQLSEKLQNLQRQRSTVLMENGAGPNGGWSQRMALSVFDGLINQVQQEAAKRSQFRATVSAFGEQGASRFFNSTDFEQMFRSYIKDAPDTTKQTELLKSINDKLSGKFKNG